MSTVEKILTKYDSIKKVLKPCLDNQ